LDTQAHQQTFGCERVAAPWEFVVWPVATAAVWKLEEFASMFVRLFGFVIATELVAHRFS
jgi:hypothetical protein